MSVSHKHSALKFPYNLLYLLILHLFTASIIIWLLQTMPIIQKFWQVTHIYTGIGNFSSTEDFPARHSIGPLKIIVNNIIIIILNFGGIGLTDLP